jgi:hypothetical protein
MRVPQVTGDGWALLQPRIEHFCALAEGEQPDTTLSVDPGLAARVRFVRKSVGVFRRCARMC